MRKLRWDGLPDWSYRVEGYELYDRLPACFDPTYCETRTPKPPDGVSRITLEPELGSLKFEDGEKILYKCDKPCTKFAIFCSVPSLASLI